MVKNFLLKHFSSSFFVALICLVLSAILLTLPASALPKEDWLDKIWFDKFVHVVLFFILVISWCRYGSEKAERDSLSKKLFLWIAIIALLYGTGMEFVQKHLIKNRSFDIGDVVADAVGCSMGLIFSLKKYIKK